jgi:hypothetical protein
MRRKDLMSGYYYLFGAYTDVGGNRMLSDTIQFYYDRTIDYKFRYRRDWTNEIFLTSHVTNDNKIALQVVNKSVDTLNLSETMLLTIWPPRRKRNIEDVPSYNLSHVYNGLFCLPNDTTSIFLDCEYIEEIIGNKAVEGIINNNEFYTVKLTFLLDSMVSPTGNIVHCI